jgi:hypothetical protein
VGDAEIEGRTIMFGLRIILWFIFDRLFLVLFHKVGYVIEVGYMTESRPIIEGPTPLAHGTMPFAPRVVR